MVKKAKRGRPSRAVRGLSPLVAITLKLQPETAKAFARMKKREKLSGPKLLEKLMHK